VAVTFDAVGPSSAGASSAASTSLSWSHVNAGSCLVVGVSMGLNTTSNSISLAVTYGGVAMASLGKVNSGGPTNQNGFVELFYLLPAAAGTATVAVTASGGTPTSLIGGSASFSGVTAIGVGAASFNPAGTLTSSLVIPTQSTTGMVVDALCWGSGTAGTATQTQRWMKNLNSSTGAGDSGQSTAAATGSAVTMTWNWITTSDTPGHIGVELLDVAPAGIFVRGIGYPVAAVNTATASVSTSPLLPVGTQRGDRVFLVVHNAPATTTPTTPTSWTLVDSQSLGTGTLGATAGPRRTSVYWRDYDGTWTMPSVTLPSVAAPALLTQSISLGVQAGRFATPTSGFGSDVTVTTTPYSATAGSTVPFSAGDLALVTIVGPGLSTLSAEGLTATGATFGTVTEWYDAASSGATNGVHGGIVAAPVTAGMATAPAVATATVSATGQSDGGSLFIQQAAVFAAELHYSKVAQMRAALY
jgi:hypothetical protein